MLLPSASGTKKLESKRKKDARQVLASAPLAEAPGGSAIALTPGSWTKTITPEAESGRKRHRVASRGTSVGDDAEKEPPTRGCNKGGRENKTAAAIAAFEKNDAEESISIRALPRRARANSTSSHPFPSDLRIFFDGPAFAEPRESARRSNKSPRNKSGGERRKTGEASQGKPRGTARSPLHPLRPQISKPLASAVSGDSTGPGV